MIFAKNKSRGKLEANAGVYTRDYQGLNQGSGSGRDCYALSQLVGEKGHVTGIDMTEGQVRQFQG